MIFLILLTAFFVLIMLCVGLELREERNARKK